MCKLKKICCLLNFGCNRNLNNLGITLLLSMQNPCWSSKTFLGANFTLLTFHLHFVLSFPSFYRSSCASIPSWWALSMNHSYIVPSLLNIMGYLISTLTQASQFLIWQFKFSHLHHETQILKSVKLTILIANCKLNLLLI